jgi:dipeptidyl aminopeptidase/acylaminoacyl peptidase
VTGGASRAVISGKTHVGDVQFTSDGKTMIYTEQSSARPVEIYRASSGGGASVPLTKLNDELLAQYHIAPAEEFWVEASDGVRVHSFLTKPANFTAGRKYPVLMLIHGGPQSAWGETWHYRWNAQVFAGAGFVVVMPNPRGSLGYGQKFTDDINQDWGGKPFEDIMDVTDYVANLAYVDRERMAAAGGSYGGYMVNWILGHTNRFKALVSHAGVFDLASSNLETEELWFPMWEFRGMPWQNPEVYARLSPSAHVKEFKTPTLVIHGELDYRVPAGQALQLFTALQLQKVPSKLVLFPDEGHWILKPQNTLFWYRNFIDWITEWTMKKPNAGSGF